MPRHFCYNCEPNMDYEIEPIVFSRLFDGETHYFDDSDIVPTSMVVVDFQEVDEEWDDVLEHELPSQEIITKPLSIPSNPTEQGWGSLSIHMLQLCQIIGVEREQYQHNFYNDKTRLFEYSLFSFKTKEEIGERI